jgi:hypothetical protein
MTTEKDKSSANDLPEFHGKKYNPGGHQKTQILFAITLMTLDATEPV